MNKKIKETRKMYQSDLINLCLKHHWYTLGDNEDYRNLLKLTDEEITTQILLEMANDIKSHSNTELEVENIMFSLSELCFSIFELKEKEELDTIIDYFTGFEVGDNITITDDFSFTADRLKKLIG